MMKEKKLQTLVIHINQAIAIDVSLPVFNLNCSCYLREKFHHFKVFKCHKATQYIIQP